MTMRNRRLQDRPPARRTPHLGDPVASVPVMLHLSWLNGVRNRLYTLETLT